MSKGAGSRVCPLTEALTEGAKVMAEIIFKAKVQELDKPCVATGMQRWVKVPRLDRKHLDQHLAQKHPRLRGYINSDLLPAVLQREFKRQGIGTQIDVDNPPEGVTVDTSNFLAEVRISISH